MEVVLAGVEVVEQGRPAALAGVTEAGVGAVVATATPGASVERGEGSWAGAVGTEDGGGSEVRGMAVAGGR